MKNFITKISFLALLFILPMQTHAAKLALTPGNAQFTSECINSLNIVVNTEGENTMATDAFLRYNPNEIEIIDSNSALGGTQIKTGQIYEAYPGNIIQNGRIWVTGVNKVGFYNGRGTFGTIFFRNKPNVTKSSISFDFSPGNTVDSNVANATPVDVLNAAYGATFTFAPGSCGEDKTPPVVTKIYPEADSMLVKLDTDIAFIIKDDYGVNLDTLSVDINGISYTKNGENKFTNEGSQNEYKITVKPIKNLPERAPVNVKIEAQDINGNSMADKIYSFNRLMPVESCKYEVCPANNPCPAGGNEDVKPSAPELNRGALYIMWIFLFFLVISLFMNVWIATRPYEKIATNAKIEFKKHKLTKKKK
jgi:hypothetical protein